jgi:acyl carrier protein
MNDNERQPIILDLLREIAPDTDPATLKPDDNIRDMLNIDSFDFLQFIVALDEQLGVSIPEEDYGKVGTLRDLMNYISALT